MDLIPIGEAAEKLQMSASALRYYDERGLVCPQTRRGGRRMYGPDELRRLAFIKISHRLGLPLDAAAAVLDAPTALWRQRVREQLGQLDDVIAQTRIAQVFLRHALMCPADHPARECPTMMGALDRLADGMSLDELMAEHTTRP